jgi:tRNA (mo5U34)-methyltransferase
MTTISKDNELRQILDNTAAAQRDALTMTGWWHSIDLGDGQITPGAHKIEELRDNFAKFLLPDLKGKRFLDIGCWDGFYSFEAERLGASVTSVDCWRPEKFFVAREALRSKAEFHELSIYEVTKEKLGAFDVVFFLGVLYHVKHPLLALEQVCEVTRDLAIIETHQIDNLFDTKHPVMEFYEMDELGGQYDNWWGPNVECLIQMTRTAGFVRVEVLRRQDTRVVIKAFRRWDDKPNEAAPSLKIVDVLNAVNLDHVLPRRGRNAVLALSVSGLPENATRDSVRVEIGDFGSKPVYVGKWGDEGNWQINVPVPLGLELGKNIVSVWNGTQLSNEFEIELTEGGQW